MVLRIEKVSDGPLMTQRLSGRLQSEYVDQLRAQIEGSAQRLILNLEEVKLVDLDAVGCELVSPENLEISESMSAMLPS
jgi:hypothetical protein